MSQKINKCTQCGGDNRITNRYCSHCGYELPKIEVQPVAEEVKPKQKVNWKALLVIAIVVAVSTLSVNFVPKLFSGMFSLDKVMASAASEINKTCPMFVDEITRLDNVQVLPNNIFQYNYTLVGVDVEQVDTIQMKLGIEPSILNLVKTNPDMKFVRDNKATLRYHYKDQSGKYICNITMPYEKYKAE